MLLLEHSEILDLHAVILRAGLAESRPALFAALERGLAATFPRAARDADQLLIDLTELNRMGALSDGTIPLRGLIESAAALARSIEEKTALSAFVDRITARSPGSACAPPARERPGAAPPLPGSPAPFAALIEEKTRDFVGRGHVFAALDRFMSRFPSGNFTLMGYPGTGKSAILAEHARRTGCVIHFNQSTANNATVGAFLDTVSAQLAARTGRASVRPPVGAAADGRFLEALLHDHAPREGDPPLVLAIDALDEVDMRGARDAPLFLPRALPRGVFLFVSTRPGPLFFVDTSLELFDLDKHPAESRLDAAAYVRLMAGRKELHDWLSRSGVDRESFVETLAGKSDGNFMYLRHVLPAITSGTYGALSLDELPAGLQAYYEDHWARMGMRSEPLPRTKLRVLYVLSELIQPMSRELIASVVREDPLVVQEVLTAWRPFLHSIRVDGQTRYHLYHASFRDFLRRQDVLSAAGITLEEIRGSIGMELLRGHEDDV